MNPVTLAFHALEGIPEVCPGDNLAQLILSAAKKCGLLIQHGDVVVVAQKIVSKSEGRRRNLRAVKPSARAEELAAIAGKDPRVIELVLQESKQVLRCRPGVIIVEDIRGFVMANAGIDASNVVGTNDDEAVLLLPERPDASAQHLRDALSAACNGSIAVVINDSWGRAWRTGTVGTALGVSGMPALLDLRGTSDRHGRKLESTEVGIADEIAAGASAIMGQAGEGRPVVIVRGFPYPLGEGDATELIRPAQMDLFR
jgi:coenzyme F420-0:L-glutamate ligase/coenzyme F420-1:gamma-L-glutamate ligase